MRAKGVREMFNRIRGGISRMDASWRKKLWMLLARFRPGIWFPHFPLALGLGLFGYRNIHPLLREIILIRSGHSQYTPVQEFRALPEFFHDLTKGPHSFIGLLEILMAVGLLFRSRFAWSVALVLVGASLGILLHQTGGEISLRSVGDLLLLTGLLVFRTDFSRSNLATGTLFSVISIILLFGYAVFGAFILGEGFSPPIQSLLTAFYFSVVTMSTVGYGDIIPKTNDARMFVVSLIIMGISVFTASLSTVVLPMMNEHVRNLLMGGGRKLIRKNHYILVGTGGLAANVFAELKGRNMPVTLIVDHKRDLPPWNEADQVEGDPADTETLKKAGVMDANALISLLENDGENAFVVLAARETGSPTKTIVSVRDRVNLARIRSVRPDMILAMDVIGAQILGMALSGEEVDGDRLLENVLFSDGENLLGTVNRNKE